MEVFNMDFLDNRFIETGLNAVGYTAAGLLWMLIYSAFNRRGKRSVVSTSQSETEVERKTTDLPPMMPSAPPTPSEFVSLGSASQSTPDATSPASASDDISTGGRRNRGEIIRIAREMVKNGVGQDTIKRTLPITDGELSLLVQSTK
jgi:hypothetical protein